MDSDPGREPAEPAGASATEAPAELTAPSAGSAEAPAEPTAPPAGSAEPPAEPTAPPAGSAEPPAPPLSPPAALPVTPAAAPVAAAAATAAFLAVGPSGAEPVQAAGVAPTFRALRRPGAPVTWLHADSADDLLPALEEFGLHELSVRSLRDGPERPRVEEFADHLYVSLVRAAPLGTPGEAAEGTRDAAVDAGIEGLRIFVGERWVLSLGRLEPEEHEALTQVIVRQVMERGRGASFVLYYLAEWVVETFYPLLDSLDTRVDSLEDLVLVDTGEETRQELFRLKRDLVDLRRRVAPTRDVMQRLSSHGLGFVDEAADVFFRDVHDDVLLVLEQLDTHRDILSSALDLHLSTVSNRLNEVMKRLTLVATLFMPITFVTGFFGMNFSGLPVASVAWFWGTMAVMAASFVTMAAYAWRRGWF